MAHEKEPPPDDLEDLAQRRIIALADQGLSTARIAAHGTVRPYLCDLIPVEERERIAFMAYVRRTVEAEVLRDTKGRPVKDKFGRTKRLFNSVVQRRIDGETGEIVEEIVYQRALLVEEDPAKRRKAFRAFTNMILGAIARCPLLGEDLKHEAICTLDAIFARAS